MGRGKKGGGKGRLPEVNGATDNRNLVQQSQHGRQGQPQKHKLVFKLLHEAARSPLVPHHSLIGR